MKRITVLIFVTSVVLMSCTVKKIETNLSDSIRINQLGFYPKSIKQFVVADISATSFKIVNEKNEVVFNGTLTNNGKWEASGENVLMGDFSLLKIEGIYKVVLDDSIHSYPFEIKKNIYAEALKASIKSFYFQRVSSAIEEKFGGEFKRESGHPDSNCLFHSSTGRTTGSLNSPGGWYDAGDYGKYIVNAAFSTGQMLNYFEQFPNGIPDNSLNIPESGNAISDLWDELKYELDWIITMQDTDGGVFHKLTSANFCGFIMPKDDTVERLIIGKGTAATLNFAAVLAQAARLSKDIDLEWSKKALTSSEKAWKWAILNKSSSYKNHEDISTGAYDDTEFSDDFYWAASELYITTKNEKYGTYLTENQEDFIHELTNSWKFFVRNNAFHSLIENRKMLDSELAQFLTNGQLKLADAILDNIEKNPYRIGLDRFEWGSNSDILNEAMILCMAHKISGEEKYLNGAEQITDYVFGKNATGYSFFTGFGSKRVLFPHHRPSGADGIEEPIPGFVIGGPNNDRQDKDQVVYGSNFPAKAYTDVEESYASNEVCINWNSPAVYVLGYLEQVRKNK